MEERRRNEEMREKRSDLSGKMKKKEKREVGGKEGREEIRDIGRKNRMITFYSSTKFTWILRS